MEERPLIMSYNFTKMIDIKNSGAKANYMNDVTGVII